MFAGPYSWWKPRAARYGPMSFAPPDAPMAPDSPYKFFTYCTHSQNPAALTEGAVDGATSDPSSTIAAPATSRSRRSTPFPYNGVGMVGRSTADLNIGS